MTTTVDRFKSQFTNGHHCSTRSTGARRSTEDVISEDIAPAIRGHFPSIPPTIPTLTTLTDHPVPPPAPPAPGITHLPNKVSPPPSSNGFSDLYSLEYKDDFVFDEIMGNDKINPIKSVSSYIISPLVVALECLPPKVAKKRRKNFR